MLFSVYDTEQWGEHMRIQKLTGIMNFLLINGCGTREYNIRGHSFFWSGACEFTNIISVTTNKCDENLWFYNQ